jgi:hypothetical protein
VLRRIQRHWSSDHPRRRIVGFVGKLAVEGGVSLLVTASILTVVLVGDSLIEEFTLPPLEVVVTVAGLPAFAWVTNKAFCNLVREVDTTTDS